MFEHPDGVQSAVFDETGELLAAGDRGGSIRLYRYDGESWSSSVAAGVLQSHQGRVYSLVFGPKPGQLVSAGEDGRLILWHHYPPAVEIELGDHGQLKDVVFVGDGSYLAMAGSEGISLIDASGSGVVHVLEAQPAWISLTVSAQGNVLAAAHENGLVRVWDLLDGPRFRVRSEWSVGEVIHEHPLALAPDGNHLAIGCWREIAKQAGLPTEGGVLVFDTVLGVRIHAFPAIRPECVAFAPDGVHLAGDSHSTVLVWNLTTGETTRVLPGHTAAVKAVAVSFDNRTVASAGWDRRLRLWDLDSQAPRLDIVAHPSGIQTLVFSPDGRSLVTGDRSGVLRIWQVATGRMLLEWKRPGVFMVKVAFSPQSDRLAYLGEDGGLRMIRAPRHQPGS